MRVQPRASRNRVIGPHGDALKVAVGAAPVDGAANAAVVATIADWLGVARSRVELVRGPTSRNKVLRVVGVDREALLARLAEDG